MQEIVITNNRENERVIMVVENGILVERYLDNNDKGREEGNIYIGIVQNVLPGMQAAFIDIGKDKNTFIHLKDIMPKKDSLHEQEVDLKTTNIKEYVKPKKKLLVQIKRDKTSNKGARVSTHVTLAGRYIVFMPEVRIYNSLSKNREF